MHCIYKYLVNLQQMITLHLAPGIEQFRPCCHLSLSHQQTYTCHQWKLEHFPVAREIPPHSIQLGS